MGSIGIGATFVLLSALLAASAVHKDLSWDPATPDHIREEEAGAVYGSYLAWPSAIIFGLLGYVKLRLADNLDSQVLRKDAFCSGLGAFLALICGLAALAEQMSTGPVGAEMADTFASGAIALILFWEGARTVWQNLSGHLSTGTEEEL